MMWRVGACGVPAHTDAELAAAAAADVAVASSSAVAGRNTGGKRSGRPPAGTACTAAVHAMQLR